MKLNSWKRSLKNAMKADWSGEEPEFNPDSPPCPDCGNTMIFHGHDDDLDFPYGEGYWQCPSCNKRITEDDL